MASRPRESDKDQLMRRYCTAPLGGGSWGVYDKTRGTFIEVYHGRGAAKKATRKWRDLVGA